MTSDLCSPRLALLIDADNTSAKIVDGLFEEIAKIGEGSARRIYGDVSHSRSKSWADTLSKHAIIPNSNLPSPLGRMHRTLLCSSMPWTCFIAAGSMASVWFPRTAISPGWPLVSGTRASLTCLSISL
jgi:hypothetical protein